MWPRLPVWTPLNQSFDDTLSFSLFLSFFSFLSFALSLSLSHSHSLLSFSVPLPHPVYLVRSFSPAPARRYSHSFAVPVDLRLLSALFSLSLSSLTLYGRPSTTPLPLRSPAFRGASVAKSRLYLVSCKSEQFASLTNDSNLRQHPL